MNTLKEFIRKSHLPSKLIRSTVKQIGGWDMFTEYAKDIAEQGADTGIAVGFIYYRDTVPFTKRNKKEILTSLQELSADLGEDLYSLIGNFNCLKMQSYEVVEGLYDPKSEYRTQVYNALAWYALEEVARSYADLSVENYCD